MAAVASTPAQWHKLPIALSELCINSVLRCGQSFRWQRKGDEWTCALQGRILSLRQDDTHLHYRAVFPPGDQPSATSESATESAADADGTIALIKSYFNLAVPLKPLYELWSARDSHFAEKSASYPGIRILRQDPWENTISFICSSNNHISRISSMVLSLCTHFGRYLGSVEGVPYHDFPEPSALTAVPDIESVLRTLNFGYRAKFIAGAATVVAQKPEGWLQDLRKADYKDAHEALLELPGVGAKVADCICLMSLDKPMALPIDTHVWQIARRDYSLKIPEKATISDAMYSRISNHFLELWGNKAGWAHAVLFAADLPGFKDQDATGAVLKAARTRTKKTETVKVVKKVAASKKRKRQVEPEEPVESTEPVEPVDAVEPVEQAKPVINDDSEPARPAAASPQPSVASRASSESLSSAHGSPPLSSSPPAPSPPPAEVGHPRKSRRIADQPAKTVTKTTTTTTMTVSSSTTTVVAAAALAASKRNKITPTAKVKAKAKAKVGKAKAGKAGASKKAAAAVLKELPVLMVPITYPEGVEITTAERVKQRRRRAQI